MANKIVNVRGEKYRAVVVRVTSCDEFGRPRTFETLYDEESTHIEGGENFWILLAPEKMCIPQTRGRA